MKKSKAKQKFKYLEKYNIVVNNEEEKKAALLFFKQLTGFKDVINHDRSFPIYVGIYRSDYSTKTLCVGDALPEETSFSISEMYKLLILTQEITVELNENYSAIVNALGVQVGCQRFEFQAIKKLYEAVLKIENKED